MGSSVLSVSSPQVLLRPDCSSAHRPSSLVLKTLQDSSRLHCCHCPHLCGLQGLFLNIRSFLRQQSSETQDCLYSNVLAPPAGGVTLMPPLEHRLLWFCLLPNLLTLL
ncbi:hypothetical protein FQA47_003394 [Oryzias melastigma]|uniref:Uncharacterized protein n=1 Tax=Oryzias melastigma TaxID=30732 RepID=A0A834CCX9_ORYME|nr:hypothetical protein FQA47_003394 [Oryzias melastigma]